MTGRPRYGSGFDASSRSSSSAVSTRTSQLVLPQSWTWRERRGSRTSCCGGAQKRPASSHRPRLPRTRSTAGRGRTCGRCSRGAASSVASLEQTFPVPFHRAYAATIAALGRCSLRLEGRGESWIRAKAGPAFRSWGQRVTITFASNGLQTTVRVESKPVFQLFDWGRGSEGAAAVLREIGHELGL